MPVFDTLQRASFDGIEFPIKSVTIRGMYRKHVHKYLRVPGGIIEKLERDPYTIEMEGAFHATIPGYDLLWPNALEALRSKFERGITSTLVIPTIGSIPAMFDAWDESADMRVRSGLTSRLPFIEDQTELFLAEALSQTQQSALSDAGSNFTATLADFEVSEADASLFDGIQDAFNSILAIKDQSNLYGGLLAAKVSQLAALIAEVDKAAQSLKDPINHELIEALHELWDAVITLGRNLADNPRGARLYTVPRTMSVSAISVELYGTTANANELMLNNALADVFAVPAGTQLIWFS